MGFDKLALATALQALVTCCHFIVDEILTSVSPRSAVVIVNLVGILMEEFFIVHE